jgi:hypothetical protein
MGVLGLDTPLTGIIHLRTLAPLGIAKEDRVIEGVLRSCVVVRLQESDAQDGIIPAPGASQTSVFSEFAGPCAGRPESGTCGSPEPIEFINGVAPDCDGIITIEFLGCAQPTMVEGASGVVLDCQLGLVDACIPPQIPNSEGLLPDEYTPANIPPYTPPTPPEPVPGPSESSVFVGALPFTDCFYDGDGNWTVVAGLWQIVEFDSPEVLCPDPGHFDSVPPIDVSGSLEYAQAAYQAMTAASRNVSLWEGFDDSTVYRRVFAEVMLLQGPVGAAHNAGIVLNYRPSSTTENQFVYFAAEINWDNQTFSISRFNGTKLQPVAPVPVPSIQLNKWYRIDVTITAAGAGQTMITAHLTSITDPGQTDVMLSLTTNAYQPSTGWFGLETDRAVANFAYMRVEAADSAA